MPHTSYFWLVALFLSLGVISSDNSFAEELEFVGPIGDLDRRSLDSIAEAAQGIATDDFSTFFSNENTVYRMNNFLSSVWSSITLTGQVIGGATCSHVGGMDYHGGELFVGLDKCNDNKGRVVVLSGNLEIKRSAVLSESTDAPFIAINPIWPNLFFTESKDTLELLGYEKSFPDNQTLPIAKRIKFIDHPKDVLDNYWRQGGDFSSSGLYFRAVDDAKDEDSNHTGIWIYEIKEATSSSSHHSENSSPVSIASKAGFISIAYNPDIWEPTCIDPTNQCRRRDELEDVDVASKKNTINILFLVNQAFDDVIVEYKYNALDFDNDGVSDLNDNCLRIPNSQQIDLDNDLRGYECDLTEYASIILPAVTLITQ